ncbi:MAG: hypothetical protein AAGD35_01920 [Actinomycetota bacterium]
MAPPDEGGSRWFIAAVLLIVVAGGALVAVFASQRESTIGVAPEAGIDHWHDAYLVHACGVDLPASTNTNGEDGIHTHGAGLVHVHPFNPTAAGQKAQLGKFFEAMGSELTDSSYTPGPGEQQLSLLESEGCDGEDAILQLAYWENAWTTEDPEIITENLADFRFDDPSGGAITLALLPEGAEIPKPPADRIALLESTNGGRE